MQRSLARETAFKLIFERELGGEGGINTITGMLELNIDELDPYVFECVDGVFSNVDAIDEEISKYLRGWTIKRLAKVDLALMRLATYEMLYRTDVPGSVSINEAVELSHKYSIDQAGPLINGVLGSISRANADKVTGGAEAIASSADLGDVK